MLQQQKQRELPTKKARLHPLELVLGWVNLLFGSISFLFFWLRYYQDWSRYRGQIAILAVFGAVLLGILLAALAGLFVLCRARRLARGMLYAAQLLTILILGIILYYRWDNYDQAMWIEVVSIFATTLWFFGFASFIKKQEESERD
ncbi:MAG: hypothetical protein NTX57_09245 [Armatimonadetes bacterium]|nr:hypothetical protein [Armatimonadota bacterium]